jgi:hypothetical protein
MAGDWIKIQHATPDKPEIFRMALDLQIPPEHVAGCLLRIWIWADIQTLHGNGVCVTGVTLDRIACYAGIANAMKKVGWLIGEEHNYSFPNFERHNGETAKTRALTGKRVAKHRNEEALQCNGNSVTREEKRRDKPSIPTLGNVAFETFWTAYPKKIGKGAAEKAFQKVKGIDLDVLLTAIAKQKSSEQWTKDGGQFIPMPTTWLNQRRWEDGEAVSHSIFAGAI